MGPKASSTNRAALRLATAAASTLTPFQEDQKVIRELRERNRDMLAALKAIEADDEMMDRACGTYLPTEFGETQLSMVIREAIAKAEAVGDRTDEAKTAAGA